MLVHEFIPLTSMQMESVFGMAVEYLNQFPVKDSGKDWLAGFLKYLCERSGISAEQLAGRSFNDCDCACGFVSPYGFVPEAGCPVHDPETK